MKKRKLKCEMIWKKGQLNSGNNWNFNNYISYKSLPPFYFPNLSTIQLTFLPYFPNLFIIFFVFFISSFHYSTYFSVPYLHIKTLYWICPESSRIADLKIQYLGRKVKRYGKYGRKDGKDMKNTEKIVKRLGKYRRKL
jgi:hypothetical protein